MITTGNCTGCGQRIRIDLTLNKVLSGCTCRAVEKSPTRTVAAKKPKKRRVAKAPPPFEVRAKVTKTSLTLWLPRAMKSKEGPNGRSWRVKHNASVQWRELVAVGLALLEPARPRHWPRIDVEYVTYGMGGAMDVDNVIGLGKPILDALVRGELIVDDKSEHVRNVRGTWKKSPLWEGFTVVHVRRASSRSR